MGYFGRYGHGLLIVAILAISVQAQGIIETEEADGEPEYQYFQVLNADMQPVAGAAVRKFGRWLPAKGWQRFGLLPADFNLEEVRGVSDQNGLCKLGVLRESLWIFLTVTATQGGLVGACEPLREGGVDDGSVERPFKLILQPPVAIEIGITRRDGSPVRGLWVTFSERDFQAHADHQSWTTDEDGRILCQLDHRLKGLMQAKSIKLTCSGRRAEFAEAVPRQSKLRRFQVKGDFNPDVKVVWKGSQKASVLVNLWRVPSLNQWRKPQNGRKFRERVEAEFTWIPDVARDRPWYVTVEVPGEPPRGAAFRIPGENAWPESPDFQYKPLAMDDGGSAYRIDLPTLGNNRLEKLRILDLNGDVIPNTQLVFRTEYPNTSLRHRDQDSEELFRLIESLRSQGRSTELTTDANGFVSVPVWEDHFGYMTVSWPKARYTFAGTHLRSFAGRFSFPRHSRANGDAQDVQTLLQFVVSGRVVDKKGRALSSVDVQIIRDPAIPGSEMKHSPWWDTETDDQGHFSIYQPFFIAGLVLQTRTWGSSNTIYGQTVPFKQGQRGIVLQHPVP